MLEPLIPDKISSQEKNDALRSIYFLKKKKCGQLKGRTCASDSKQRPYITQEELSSPTVSIKGHRTTLGMDAHIKKVVATTDVVGDYLNALIDDFMAMKLE